MLIKKSANQKPNTFFPGGYYSHFNSIFDEIESCGVFVPKKDRFYPYYISYDFEAMIQKIGNGTQRVAEHVPISVAVGSNIPSLTDTRCFINSDGNALVKDMTEYMLSISEHAETVMKT